MCEIREAQGARGARQQFHIGWFERLVTAHFQSADRLPAVVGDLIADKDIYHSVIGGQMIDGFVDTLVIAGGV